MTPLLVGAKTLSYAPNMEAQRRARAAGADEALLVDADGGLVLEGPTTSFAWLKDGVLYFPPLDVGVLDSITRRLAAEAVPVRERRATLADLAGAEGAVIMSTLQEAQPVAEIAGVVRLDPAAPAVAEVREAIRRCAGRAWWRWPDGARGPRRDISCAGSGCPRSSLSAVACPEPTRPDVPLPQRTTPRLSGWRGIEADPPAAGVTTRRAARRRGFAPNGDRGQKPPARGRVRRTGATT